MISFKVPTKDLRLFLVALNMNFSAPEPDYIFQVPDGFEICYTKPIEDPAPIDHFVHALWENQGSTGLAYRVPEYSEVVAALQRMVGAFDGDQKSDEQVRALLAARLVILETERPTTLPAYTKGQ